MADVQLLATGLPFGIRDRLVELGRMIDKYIPGHRIVIVAANCPILGGLRITRVELSAGEGASQVTMPFLRGEWQALGVLMACEMWVAHARTEPRTVGSYYSDPRAWAEHAFLQQVGEAAEAEELARTLHDKGGAACDALPGVFPGTNEPERINDADGGGTDGSNGGGDAGGLRDDADGRDAVPPAGVAGTADARRGATG